MRLKLFFSMGALSLIALVIFIQVIADSPVHSGAQVGGQTTTSSPPSHSSAAPQIAQASPNSEAAGRSAASRSLNTSPGSAAKSSLSWPKVDPAQQIKDFLNAMDNTAVPKVATRELKRDELFDYAQATPEQLKTRALAGDTFAAWDYANYVRWNLLRVKDAQGNLVVNPDPRKRQAAAQEMREFLVRAVNGGMMIAAFTLSQEYGRSSDYMVESLAWRKIAFAMGESEKFDCLRDSTTCVVKDFNNLNQDELFFPCVRRAYDNCSHIAYEDATLLALQYLDSLEFAIKNIHKDGAGVRK